MGKKRKFERDDGELLAGGLGHHQQLSVAGVSPSGAASSNETPVQSLLAQLLLYEVMWGFMQPGKAQKIAELAWADGARGAALDTLRKTGSSGCWSRNVWRDIKNKMPATFLGSALQPFVAK